MSDLVPNNLKARVKESYDAMAGKYASEYTNADDPTRLNYIEKLIEKLALENSKANVLELGCGAGIPATKFMLQNKEPEFHVTGNDLSTTQLNHARSNLAAFKDRLALVDGDMLSLHFPESTFDAVTGFYSIIHLPRHEQTQMMHKISVWLKPGGLFLANFSAEELPHMEVDNWMDHEKGYMYWSGWGAEGTLKMIKDVGLEILMKETHQPAGDANFLWVLAKKQS